MMKSDLLLLWTCYLIYESLCAFKNLLETNFPNSWTFIEWLNEKMTEQNGQIVRKDL